MRHPNLVKVRGIEKNEDRSPFESSAASPAAHIQNATYIVSLYISILDRTLDLYKRIDYERNTCISIRSIPI